MVSECVEAQASICHLSLFFYMYTYLPTCLHTNMNEGAENCVYACVYACAYACVYTLVREPGGPTVHPPQEPSTMVPKCTLGCPEHNLTCSPDSHWDALGL